VSRSALVISAVLCLIQSVPSLWDTLPIGKPADFPGGRAASNGSLTTSGGEMLARVTAGGASYARGVVDFTRRTDALGSGRTFELSGRFRFDADGHYVSVMRADDFAAYGTAAIQLGVERQQGDGRLHIAARRYDDTWTGFDVASLVTPEPRREYRLRLRVTVGSDAVGGASTQLWVDGALAAATTAPNVLPGRAFTKARMGVVAVAGAPASIAMRDLEVRTDRPAWVRWLPVPFRVT